MEIRICYTCIQIVVVIYTLCVLCREYVKFELLYVEKLRARQKVLKIEKADKDEEAEMEKDEQEEEEEEEEKDEKEEEEEKDGAKSRKKKDEEINDTILNCGLVNLVIEVCLFVFLFCLFVHP